MARTKFGLMLIIAAILITLGIPNLYAENFFTDIGAGFTNVSGDLAWGDYDNDGDLDLAIAGDTSLLGSCFSKIYRNDGGTFTDIGAGLTGVRDCSLAWGDYDNDGDLDLALAGYASGGCVSKIYRNDSGTFTDIGAGLIGVSGDIAWGDYDNDGDLDLALAGSSVCKIYRNTNGIFTDIGAGLTGVRDCSLAWGDYDNDGDLDLALAGYSSGAVSKIYRNDSGTFTDIGAGLIGVYDSSLAWGDYDNDGDLDLALAGFASGAVSKIYRNDNGVFTDTGAALTGVSGDIAWGDYDNDGDLDLALAGYSNVSDNVSKIYCNTNGVFTQYAYAHLERVKNASLAWGDYDNDGDLDLAMAGYYYSNTSTVMIYRNYGGALNTPPSAPTGLTASPSGVNIIFSWNAAIDAQTPAGGLSYNLHVGTTPGASDIFSGMASPSTGLRSIPSLGNTQKRLSWTLKGLPGKTYYWSVQAVDTAFAGSQWAAESTILTYTPAITGHIKNLDGTPISGVTVTASGGCISSTSDSSGYYAVYVPIGWSGTLTPTKNLCSLNPESRTYTNVTTDQSNQDYTAQPWPIISGYIRTSGGAGLVGAYAHTSDGMGTAWTDSNGYYSLKMPYGWSGTVTTFKNLYSFVPPNKVYANVTADQSNQDYTAYQYAQISGCVRMGAGTATGLPLVSVEASGIYGIYINTSTDSNGYYSLWVPYDWTGTVTPSKGSYTFNPQNREYSNIQSDSGSQDFTGLGGFMDIEAALTSVQYSALAWGDYDNDGDLDLAIAGNSGDTYISKIYRNDGGTFTDIGAGLTGVRDGSLAWGDYDNDGDLDLAIAGYSSGGCVSKIYRNTNGVFTDIGVGLTGVQCSSLAWGDYDNDGDLDLALAGYSDIARTSKIYQNINGIFTDIGAGLTGVALASLAWGDYDNDGDLDLAIAGSDGSHGVSKIYRNTNGVFADIGAGLAGFYSCSIAWGDYDNDGDLDLAVAGSSVNYLYVSKIYRNNSGVFADIGAGLTGASSCSLAWGDYDNDGDLDLALAGYSDIARISKIYQNINGIFTDIGAGLTGVALASLAWGDYDNDGDLDLALAGATNNSSGVSIIYRNDAGAFNTIPSAPTGLTASPVGSDITFDWDPASDTQTPELGLSYNLRVGTTPGGSDVFSGMSSASGYRRIPSTGNAQKMLSWALEGLSTNQTYYWSVQAIDSAFAGSAWSPEQSVFLDPVTRNIAVNLVLDNYSGDATQVPITVTLMKHGGTTTVRTIDHLGADGSFTLQNVEVGTYDISFKASHWLRKTLKDVVVQ